MPDFGVTTGGFVIKPFTTILSDKADRARAMFGSDVDLRSTSSLRKLLDITSAEDQDLWKRMEQLYYSNFLSTASGDALDLLGQDMGVTRRFLNGTGSVTLTLNNGTVGRVYNLPLGTLLETDAPVTHFRTLDLVSLSTTNKSATVAVEALERGPAGNAAIGAVNKVNAQFAQFNLNLGAATVQVSNAAALTGGDATEEDTSYRTLLLGYPRTIWTLESVRTAVKLVDGVRDCRLFDPLGGVDVSQTIFQFFGFGQRRFGNQRLLGTPYFFDILVAVYPGFPWDAQVGITGVHDAVESAVADVRPVSIFPNIRRANNVLIGLRATVQIASGHDKNGVIASITDKLTLRVDALGLGGGVLFSQVQCDIMSVAGVLDVQGLHLRRSPPVLSRVTFGGPWTFQTETIEAAIGENIDLAPNEIAVFEIDSDLIDIEVNDR